MHFGRFLIEQRAATQEQVLRALDEQRRSIPFIGELAVREGLLTVEQVLEILDRQLATHRDFGEQGMLLGYLDFRDYRRLGELKKEAFVPIGEVLVRQGVLSQKRMFQLLKDHLEAESKRRTPATAEVGPVN